VVQDQEPREVIMSVLDPARQDVQCEELAGHGAADGGGGAGRVCGNEGGGFGSGADVLTLDAGEVGGEEGGALGPGLRVGVEFCYP